MRIRYLYYKDAKKRALTVSYDDGQRHDLRLLDIFNAHGIRGSFHLNSGLFGGSKLTAEEVSTAYAGHELSAHSLTHPHLERISPMEVVHEILEDRKNLESLCGYPVRGMSYPFGSYTEQLIAQLKVLGICYSRTTKSTGAFTLPEDFLTWHPTCHHKDPKLLELLEKFLAYRYPMPLFYVWGHSYEFENDGNWDLIERFSAEAGGKEDVWYATNIEIYDYITALRGLVFSADRTMVQNPSATDVWIDVDGEAVKIPAGEIVSL